MATESITLQLDSEVARLFNAASPEERKKMEALLSLWLKDIATVENLSLKEVMNRLSKKAEERGLTPEILESLLNED